MKKILSLTLVVIMLLTSLALTSCEEILGAIGGAIVTATTEKQEDKVRTTITEMEWIKAFDLKNYTLEIKSDSLNVYHALSESAVYIKNSMGSSDSEGNFIEAYFDLANGYQIEKTADGYLVTKSQFEEENFHYFLLTFVGDIEYSDLTYQPETKTYMYKLESGEAIYEFRFEDGKLISMEAMSTDPTENESVTLKNIGTTVVELPEYTVDNCQVSESEWNRNMSSINYTVDAKGKISQVIGDEEHILESIAYLKSTPNASEMIEDGETTYSVLIDGVWYEVTQSEDGTGYVAEACSPGYVGASEIRFVLNLFGDEVSYSDFEYDTALKAYVHSINEESYTMICRIYFENGVLIRVECFVEQISGESKLTYDLDYKFSDIGTTEVEVPAFTIVE